MTTPSERPSTETLSAKTDAELTALAEDLSGQFRAVDKQRHEAFLLRMAAQSALADAQAAVAALEPLAGTLGKRLLGRLGSERRQAQSALEDAQAEYDLAYSLNQAHDLNLQAISTYRNEVLRVRGERDRLRRAEALEQIVAAGGAPAEALAAIDQQAAEVHRAESSVGDAVRRVKDAVLSLERNLSSRRRASYAPYSPGGMNIAGMNVGGVNVGGITLAGVDLGGVTVGGVTVGGVSVGGMSTGGFDVSSTISMGSPTSSIPAQVAAPAGIASPSAARAASALARANASAAGLGSYSSDYAVRQAKEDFEDALRELQRLDSELHTVSAGLSSQREEIIFSHMSGGPAVAAEPAGRDIPMPGRGASSRGQGRSTGSKV